MNRRGFVGGLLGMLGFGVGWNKLVNGEDLFKMEDEYGVECWWIHLGLSGSLYFPTSCTRIGSVNRVRPRPDGNCAVAPEDWIYKGNYEMPVVPVNQIVKIRKGDAHLKALTVWKNGTWKVWDLSDAYHVLGDSNHLVSYFGLRNGNLKYGFSFDRCPENKLSDKEMERIKAAWVKMFQGRVSSGQFYVSTPGAKVEPWDGKPIDMNY